MRYSRCAIRGSCWGPLTASSTVIVGATAANYIDAKSRQTVYVYHAKLDRLRPDTSYLYGAHHDGVEPAFAMFRTAPRGRGRYTFTSFGDQATPTVGKNYKPPKGITIENRRMRQRHSRTTEERCRHW